MIKVYRNGSAMAQGLGLVGRHPVSPQSRWDILLNDLSNQKVIVSNKHRHWQHLKHCYPACMVSLDWLAHHNQIIHDEMAIHRNHCHCLGLKVTSTYIQSPIKAVRPFTASSAPVALINIIIIQGVPFIMHSKPIIIHMDPRAIGRVFIIRKIM